MVNVNREKECQFTTENGHSKEYMNKRDGLYGRRFGPLENK